MRRLRDLAWLAAAAAVAALTCAVVVMLLLLSSGFSLRDAAHFGGATLQISARIAFLAGFPILVALYFTRHLTLRVTTAAGAVVGLLVPVLLSTWHVGTVLVCVAFGALSALSAYPVARLSNKREA